MKDIRFIDIKGEVGEYGTFENCTDIVHENEEMKVLHKNMDVPGSFDNR